MDISEYASIPAGGHVSRCVQERQVSLEMDTATWKSQGDAPLMHALQYPTVKHV